MTDLDHSVQFGAFGRFQAAGDLRERLLLNFNRLEEEKYQPDHVFQREKESSNWPGDTEGRTVLALVLLAQATDRAPRHLDGILARWPGEVNRLGYFGDIHEAGVISEQQLSGHGWVLRALAELERWKPGGPARALAQPILDNLILPTAGKHRIYPLLPSARSAEGSYSGTHLGRVGDWLLSTDVGCDFICLDGVVHAYDVFRDERLPALIDEMVSRFLEMDLLALRAQTHATLTACRALLRWSVISGSSRLVDEVAQRFQLYTEHAWTEHYANFNWFGRPQWTEPCAIVDSLMVAMELWRRTAKDHYLEQAQLIYFNALGHAQRSNGGFGCDNCPGGDSEEDVFFRVYEAHWCCTMRGGEGLSRMCQFAAASQENGILLPWMLPGTIETEAGVVRVESKYPTDFAADIEIPESVNVRVFVPSWVEGASARGANGEVVTPGNRWLSLTGGRAWVIQGKQSESARETLSVEKRRMKVVRCRGPLVLAKHPTRDTLEPIFDARRDGVVDLEKSHRRILWDVSESAKDQSRSTR